MDKPKVFISHIGEEAQLAQILKTHFLNDFLGMIDVFVSSDSTSITVGNKWLNDIDDALKTAQIELILCSYESVKRPWINFEAGAGWVKGIPVVPVCHTSMRPVDLPIPLNMLQAIEAKDKNVTGIVSGRRGIIARTRPSAIIQSVSAGKCGPCCSVAPSGKTAIQSRVSAPAM